MPVYLSPGVFVNEITLPTLPAAVGGVLPAFVGTSTKGPLNKPVLLTNAQQAVDTFGPPTPTSYLMYAILKCLEQSGSCYGVRVGVVCEEGQPAGLSDICIDTSGANGQGWGRIPLFSGIDFGRIFLREVAADATISFHPASTTTPAYNQAVITGSHGVTDASATVTGTYTGSIADAVTVLITGAPTVSSNERVGGATFQASRASDGAILAEGVLSEAGGAGVSQAIDLGDGLSVTITVVSGVLGVNDTFTFNVLPDNRNFTVSVNNVAGATRTMPTATYSTNADFIAAFNGLLSSDHYTAVEATLADGTVVPQIRTIVEGDWIQLLGSAAFCATVGQSQYAFDIPRSYLIGTVPGPYSVSAANNQIVMNVIGASSTKQVSFTTPPSTGISAAQLAANLNPAGIVGGTRYFDVIALTVPGGEQLVAFIVTVNNEFDVLQLLASFTNLKTLNFATLIGITFPYTRGYRGFTDTRLTLPAPGVSDPAVPLTCEQNPLSAQCAADAAYFQNIVGWLVATSAGSWINKYTATLSLFTGGIGDPSGRYQIAIVDQNGLTVDLVTDVSFDKTATRYIGNVVNPGSPIGGTAGDPFYNWEPRPAYLDFDPNVLSSYVVRQPSAFTNMLFLGGADGIPTDPAFSSSLDAAIIGNPALGSGIFTIQNPNTFPINMLATPGFSSGAVIGQCLQLCEGRGDLVYLVDPPFGLKPQQIVDWHNGMLFSNLEAAIDSSYGGLYWSWEQIFDQFNNINIWIPPSGPVSAVFARTANVGQFRAPAGTSRGRLLTALDIEYNPSRGEMDLLYGFGNAVNPIIKVPNRGVCVFGQRTLQREDTILDRMDVRMLFINLKQAMIPVLRDFLFEPNDPILWSQVTNTLNPILANVAQQRGITAFKVVCDKTNNTPARIDAHQLWVSVFVMPEEAVEFVVLNLVGLQASASFSAAEVLAAGGVVTAA